MYHLRPKHHLINRKKRIKQIFLMIQSLPPLILSQNVCQKHHHVQVYFQIHVIRNPKLTLLPHAVFLVLLPVPYEEEAIMVHLPIIKKRMNPLSPIVRIPTKMTRKVNLQLKRQAWIYQLFFVENQDNIIY